MKADAANIVPKMACRIRMSAFCRRCQWDASVIPRHDVEPSDPDRRARSPVVLRLSGAKAIEA
jgi:hypothetical protein